MPANTSSGQMAYYKDGTRKDESMAPSEGHIEEVVPQAGNISSL